MRMLVATTRHGQKKVPPLGKPRKCSGDISKKIGRQMKIIPSAVSPQTLYYRVIFGELTLSGEKSRQGWARWPREASYLVQSS